MIRFVITLKQLQKGQHTNLFEEKTKIAMTRLIVMAISGYGDHCRPGIVSNEGMLTSFIPNMSVEYGRTEPEPYAPYPAV